jgi:hypothetical protein
MCAIKGTILEYILEHLRMYKWNQKTKNN